MGAVAGTVAAGFVLLPTLGLRLTVGVAVALATSVAEALSLVAEKPGSVLKAGGIDIVDWFRRRPRPLEAVVRAWMHLAEACGAMEQRGICHRDLKPENLFVTRAPDGDDWVMRTPD